MTVIDINIITKGLAGALSSLFAWLATMPSSLQFVSTILMALPVSLLMARFGKHPVFLARALLAICTTPTQAYALYTGRFVLFCIGACLLNGRHTISNFIFAQPLIQYRHKINQKLFQWPESVGWSPRYLCLN